jgi:hypothetical protein
LSTEGTEDGKAEARKGPGEGEEAMTLRSVRAVFAFVVVLGGALGLAVTPAAADRVLDWQVIGTGTGSCALTGTPPNAKFVCTFSGNATGTHVGDSTYSVMVTLGSDVGLTGSVADCFLASGPGMVTAADGSIVNFNTVGLFCGEVKEDLPVQYNGTYRITGGSDRFGAAVGGGNLAATVTATVTGGGVSFIKIDGTINF